MFDINAKFSLWCDFVERDFLNTEFIDLVMTNTINGATSNPSIFKSAFLNSSAYKNIIKENERRGTKEIYELLATQDIKVAANKLLKNFANDDDGFVSIEVDPNFCDNTAVTVDEGTRLFNTIAMPNVMIKIPATKDGFDAMAAFMARGISVNATLVFSPEQAKGCLDAFEVGSEIYKKRFPNTKLPSGVISIFVSRFDRLLDESMMTNSLPTGQIGIMNATKIYKLIEAKALPNVRALFASTGVKGDELPKDYYVRELMFKNSINTAPLETIKVFTSTSAIVREVATNDSIEKFFDVVARAKIDIQKVYKELLNDGLKQFVLAFEDIMRNLK